MPSTAMRCVASRTRRTPSTLSMRCRRQSPLLTDSDAALIRLLPTSFVCLRHVPRWCGQVPFLQRDGLVCHALRDVFSFPLARAILFLEMFLKCGCSFSER